MTEIVTANTQYGEFSVYYVSVKENEVSAEK